MLSLYFKTKPNLPTDKKYLIEIFFKDWVDSVCNKEVDFSIERNIKEDWVPGMVETQETFRVDFNRSEDAVILKLKGIPVEFKDLIEQVK